MLPVCYLISKVAFLLEAKNSMQIRNLYEEITIFLMIFLKISSNVHDILIYAFLLTINACMFNAFSIIKIYKSGSISAKVEKNAFKCC